MYALLGIGIAYRALLSATEEVSQVQTRLGVAGLVAALFDREHSERPAGSDERLFVENVSTSANDLKKIAVMKTKEGGSSFTLCQ